MELGAGGVGWFVAATGFITGIGALVLNRRGQKEQAAVQRAANRIAHDKHRLEETQQALESLEKALGRANEEADRYRARAEASETALDEAKMLSRQMYAAQAAQCQAYAQELTEAILLLRQVVTDEIAAAAADDALGAPRHPHDPPPRGGAMERST